MFRPYLSLPFPPAITLFTLAVINPISLLALAYIIDDSNTSTLQYIVSPSAKAKWGPFGGDTGEVLTLFFSGVTLQVNESLAYNDTFTYGACHLSDGCSITVPFTGSGATVYALQAGAQGINVSVTVDNGPPSINVLSPISGPPYERGKNTLFDVQDLNSSAHSLTLNVLEWSGTFSGMMLDYVDVNETAADPAAVSSAAAASASATRTATTTTGTTTGTASAASATSTTTNSNSTSHATTHTGRTAGIVIGTLGALATLSFLLFFFCMRKNPKNPNRLSLLRRFRGEVDQTYIAQPFEYNAAAPATSAADSFGNGMVSGYPPSSAALTESHRSLLASPGSAMAIANHPNSSITSPNTAGTRTSNAITADNNNNRSPIGRSKLATYTAQIPPSASTGPTTSSTQRGTITSMAGTDPDPDVHLTDEQVDFVNSLHRQNIPASAIARIMERMLNGGDTDVAGGVEGMDVGMDQAPPSYDFHQAT